MDNGDPKTTGGIREGTKRLAGDAIAGGRGGLDSAGGRSPSCGRWLQAHPTPHPHPGASLSPRRAFRCPERPLRARFLPRVRGDSGTQFRGRPRTHCGPCVPSKAGRSRRAAGVGRGSCMAAESPLPSQPARPGVARPQPPGTWARAPQGPAPSCREPRPAAAGAAPAWGWGLGRGRSQARGRCQVAPVTVTCRGVGGASTQVAYFRK